MATTNDASRFPLLDSLLKARGRQRQAIYNVKDIADIFEVSVRTINDWFREGKFVPRDLPGRGRALSEDLEDLVQSSRGRKTRKNEKNNN
jgi:hypothetical protein